MIYDKDDLNRFLGKVDITLDPDACWNWNAFIAPDGYGKLSVGYRTVQAHRFSYEWFFGEILPDHIVHHTCMNKKCVNPIHLQMLHRSKHSIEHADQISKGLRNEYCHKGHEMKDPNIYYQSNGDRHCKVCKDLYNERRRMARS